MPRLPRPRSRAVVTALKRAGFIVIRIRGSHHMMQHPDGRRTVVPVHAGEVIRPGTLLSILEDTGLSVEEFIELI